MGIETMQIQGYPKWQRVYAVCVFVVVGVFFVWLYWNNRSSEGSWIGLIMIVLCFWQAIYWVCLPKVLGVLKTDGMDYINEDLGFLFYYPWFHIDWNQVTNIQTSEQSDKIQSSVAWYRISVGPKHAYRRNKCFITLPQEK